MPVYDFYSHFRLTITLAYRLGFIKELIICLPVHKDTGFKIVGAGILMSYEASANQEIISQNYDRVKNISLEVIRKDVVRKS